MAKESLSFTTLDGVTQSLDHFFAEMKRYGEDIIADHSEYERQCLRVCSICQACIKEGQRMWSVPVHQAVLKDGRANVVTEDCGLVFCADCAATRDFKSVVVPVKRG